MSTRELVRDLWRFIENVNPVDPVPSGEPSYTDQFFALRERVRNFYAQDDKERGQ